MLEWDCPVSGRTFQSTLLCKWFKHCGPDDLESNVLTFQEIKITLGYVDKHATSVHACF